MRTNDENLEAAVTHWHADAEPPAALRARVLENATATPSPVPHAPRVNRRRVWWATGAVMAISAASIVIVATVSTPARPAFAEVEAAMSKVKTVQWVTQSETHELKTGVKSKGQGKYTARLFPPAIRTDLGGGIGNILTADWHVDVWPVGDHPYRRRTPAPEYLWFRRGSHVSQLQEHIRSYFLPPRAGRLKIEVTEVVENGKRLMRYVSGWETAKTVAKPKGERYIKTMWVDPDTRRAVRVKTEYFDHWRHSVTVADNFRYDEPLPDSLFDTSP